jgi:hypothetical protein
MSSLTSSDPIVCEPYPFSGEYRGTSLIRNWDVYSGQFFLPKIRNFPNSVDFPQANKEPLEKKVDTVS